MVTEFISLKTGLIMKVTSIITALMEKVNMFGVLLNTLEILLVISFKAKGLRKIMIILLLGSIMKVTRKRAD